MAAVIANSELERIRNGMRQETASTVDRREHAINLHRASQERASKWTNTVVGARRKKDRERRDRMEKEEVERQAQDEQEAQIEVRQRQAVIERANRILRDDSDRMKSFHSKMLFSDVLAEREAQVALKQELDQLDQVREERFLEMNRQNARKMLERELRERESREKTSLIASAGQKQQLEETRERRLREFEDEITEGSLLKKKADEDMLVDKEAALARQGRAAQALVETQKANAYLKKIKEEDARRQQREDASIEAYAARKEHAMMLRKQKEKSMFDDRQRLRQRMIDLQAARLAEASQRQDDRVEAQVLEKDIKDEKERLRKAEMQREWKDSVARSREEQMDLKRAQAAKDKADSQNVAEFWTSWCSALDEQERQDLGKRRLTNRKLAQAQLRQAELRRRREEEEAQKEKAVVSRAERALEADRIEFHKYAENVVKDYAEDGRNVVPLIKQLREFSKGDQ